MKTERMITAEYPTVLKRSTCRGLLETAHGIAITEEAALQVIYAYLDENDFQEGVRFTGKMGPGRCECKKNGHFRVVNLRLPSENSKKLTLGMTLHEVAHALNYIDHNEANHGDSFVAVLDNLVMSEWYWDEEEAAKELN